MKHSGLVFMWIFVKEIWVKSCYFKVFAPLASVCWQHVITDTVVKYGREKSIWPLLWSSLVLLVTTFILRSFFFYSYMHTNNVIIFNNQSKGLIALWCLHVTSKALSLIYMQFPLFLLFSKNCGYFIYCHYSHTPLHSTNDGLRKSRCVYRPLF